jgi:hypothetical protein
MLERITGPETSRPTPGLRLPGQAGMSSQLLQFAIIVLGIALVTFVMYLYVLPNSQINAAGTKIAELQAQKAELHRRNSEVLEEIAVASDLKSLEIRARQIGMGPVESAIYLRMPDSDTYQDGNRIGQIGQVDAASNQVVEPGLQDKALPESNVERQAKQLLKGVADWADGMLNRLLGD